MDYDVFISYSRKDIATADRICAALDRAGISYFIDREGLSGGTQFMKLLATNILDSRVFLLLGSENAYTSSYVSKEIHFAVEYKNGHILPYLIDKTPLPVDYKLMFGDINIRNIDEHPIESVLMNDIRLLLDMPVVPVVPTVKKKDDRKGLYAALAAVVLASAVCWWYFGSSKTEIDNAPKQEQTTTEAAAQTVQTDRSATPQTTKNETPKAQQSAKTATPAAATTQPAQSKTPTATTTTAAPAVQSPAAQPTAAPAAQPAAAQTTQQVQTQQPAATPAAAPVQEVSASELVSKGVAAVRKFQPEQAVGYFKQAAAKGSVEANYHLGELYYNGNGVDKSFPTAAGYFEKAANAGMADAQYMLGVMYRNGQGVTKDISTAKAWLMKAASQGHAKAEQMLNKL